MENYKGVIIEESLSDKSVLSKIKIVSTEVEEVNDEHKTPWLTKWTLHTVEIEEEKSDDVAQMLSVGLEKAHPWYADYKNSQYHYIIFSGKIFKIDRNNEEGFREAKEYGVSLGIPEYQVDFTPQIK